MYKKWEVVLTVFPFTDLSAEKVRPAVIISEQPKDDDVVVAFISSRLIYRDQADILVEKTSSEFKQTGLKIDSVIRLRKIAAVNKKIILGTIGVVGPNTQKEILKTLKLIFEF